MNKPDKKQDRQQQRIQKLEEKLKEKDEVLAELMEEYVIVKKSWGDLNQRWVAHDIRDQVIDFVHRWGEKKTEIGTNQFIQWLAISSSKFYDWNTRYGKVNEHNAWVPRDFWLQDWEKQATIDFHQEYPLEGYRRLTFMMLDRNVVAVSPSSVWRVVHVT